MSTTNNLSTLVSIAVCTYNGEKHLEEQLESLVNQTYLHKEIIVVDDCSSDQTVSILEKYSSIYPFFHFSVNEKNLGYVKNFEKAILLCKGNYIALSDQDDIWLLNKVEEQVKNIGEHALIYHDSTFINEEGDTMEGYLSDTYTLYSGKKPLPFLFFNCVSGHSLLFNRIILPDLIPFPESYFHDRWLALIASERGGVKLMRGCFVKYRQHVASTTDTLNLKGPDKQQLEFFNPERLKWILYCSEKSIYFKGYFKAVYSCFSPIGKILHSLRLFFLLAMYEHLIFYTIKKSHISRINYLRKICFPPER
jgi:glycosyltransferase involved in cell wall biosynthesis